VAILREAWMGHDAPRFFVGPLLGHPSFFLRLTYAVNKFQSAIF